MRRPVRTVKFDQSSSIAIITDLTWTGLKPLAVAVAEHVATTARLKRGEWFVHVDPDNTGGHLFFRGRKTILTFTVEGTPWSRNI